MNTQSKENLCEMLFNAPQLVGALSSKGATLIELMGLYEYFQSINDEDYSKQTSSDLATEFKKLFAKYNLYDEQSDVYLDILYKPDFDELPVITVVIIILFNFFSFMAMKSVENTEIYQKSAYSGDLFEEIEHLSYDTTE